MGRTKPRGYPLRRWLGIDDRPRKARRRSLARTEQEPEPEEPEVVWNDLPERYRDAAGVWQGGRDGYGWQRYGGDQSTGEITFMNRRDQ
jgi:hypothetical protein